MINLVFRDLPAETVAALRDGSLGIALTAASILFLLGTLAFVTAMLRTREVPAAPLVLYAIGAVPSRSEPSFPRRCSTSVSPSSPSESPGSGSGSSTAPTASPPGR